MVPVTCPLCTLPQRVTVHSVVSVFLRHSRTEAVAHCTHTSAYQHTVVPDIETLYFWAVADVAWGEERAPGWRTIPLYAGDLYSCKGHPNFHTFLLFGQRMLCRGDWSCAAVAKGTSIHPCCYNWKCLQTLSHTSWNGKKSLLSSEKWLSQAGCHFSVYILPYLLWCWAFNKLSNFEVVGVKSVTRDTDCCPSGNVNLNPSYRQGS